MKKSDVQCIGFIMDGNRRWAKEKGLPTYEGHRKGGEVFMESVKWARERAISHVVVYAFSTENWKRSDEEVTYLMDLFREWMDQLERQISEALADGKEHGAVRIKIIGRRDDFPSDIVEHMTQLEQKSQNQENISTTIWFALSYGGRAEIVAAANEAVRQGKEVTEESFEKLLWTADLPDPDIIVRASGEQRLSNFLTWRSVYSELMFIDKYWPDFTRADFDDILKEYASRERRNGK